MKYNNILVDGNNIFWRYVLAVFKDKISSAEEINQYSAVIFNCIKRIKEFHNEYGYDDTKVYILFDNPNSKITARKEIDEEYKHPRDAKYVPEAFYKALDFVQEILKDYDDCFLVAKADGAEADDLVKPILKMLSGDTLLVSADLDWARSIDQNVHWFNWVKIYNLNLFLEKYGFSPVGNGLTMYKTFRGDNSDNIKNVVPRLPEVVLLHIVENYSNIDMLMTALWTDEKIPKAWKVKIHEAEIFLRTNYKLVNFVDFNSEEEYIITCKQNIAKLKKWFAMFGVPMEPRFVRAERVNFFQAVEHTRAR